MAVLPESMDKLDMENVPKSLSIIENYIRYMGERIEFSTRNVTRNVSAAGVSSAEMYVLVTALSNQLSALQSTVSGMQGNLNTLQGAVSGMQGEITEIHTQINGLDERVAALENPTSQGG